MQEEHASSFSLISIGKAEQFLDILSRRNGTWKPNPFVWAFRGEADANWKLIPRLFRSETSAGLVDLSELKVKDEILLSVDNTTQLAIREHDHIQKFITHSDRVGLSIPEDNQVFRSLATYTEHRRVLAQCLSHDINGGTRYEWPSEELLPIYALARHHGIPTRLLDWTWDPRIAAYFAVRDAAEEWVRAHYDTAPGQSKRERTNLDEKKIAVWALNMNDIRSNWPALVTDEGSRIEQRMIPRLRTITVARAPNPNLHAQSGLFTLDGALRRVTPLNVLLSQGSKTNPVPYLNKFTLPYEQTPKLMKLLAYEEVTAATVYAGYDGVARSVLERKFWERVE